MLLRLTVKYLVVLRVNLIVFDWVQLVWKSNAIELPHTFFLV